MSLEGLVPHYHRRSWGVCVCVGGMGWDMRHSLREEQESGRRYKVGFQSQTQTYCSELEDPKGQAGASAREKDTGTQDREALMLSPKLDQCRPLVAT